MVWDRVQRRRARTTRFGGIGQLRQHVPRELARRSRMSSTCSRRLQFLPRRRLKQFQQPRARRAIPSAVLVGAADAPTVRTSSALRRRTSPRFQLDRRDISVTASGGANLFVVHMVVQRRQTSVSGTLGSYLQGGVLRRRRSWISNAPLGVGPDRLEQQS